MANLLDLKISETLVIRAYERPVYDQRGNKNVVLHHELAFSVGPATGAHTTLADGPAVQALLAMAAHATAK